MASTIIPLSSSINSNESVGSATIDSAALKIFWGHIAQGSVSLIVSLYAFITFTVYEIRQKTCWVRVNSNDRHLSLASRILCMLTSFMSAISSVSTFYELLANKSHFFGLIALQNQTACTAIASAWFLLCGTSCVYLFLWMRQRVFYIDPMLSEITGRGLEGLSFLVLAGWIGYFIYGSIILGTRVTLIYVPELGCSLPVTAVPVVWKFFLSFVIACSVMQASLLFLFIYPLLRHHLNRSSIQTQSKSLHRRVVKATCLTSICVFTDCIAYLTFYVFSSNTFPIYGLNLALNSFTIVLCFDFWKEVLIPCGKERHGKKLRRSEMTNNSSGSTMRTLAV